MKLEFAVLFVISTTILVAGLKTEKFIEKLLGWIKAEDKLSLSIIGSVEVATGNKRLSRSTFYKMMPSGWCGSWTNERIRSIAWGQNCERTERFDCTMQQQYECD